MYRPTTISASDPTVDEDYSNGYRSGNFWKTPTDLYILEDEATGAANWESALSGENLGDWDSWTPSYTWYGDQPSGVATVGRYCMVGDTVYITLQVSGTAGIGASGVTDMTCTLPVDAADLSSYIPLEFSGYIGVADWSKGHFAVIDSASDPRKIAHICFTVIPSGTAFRLHYSGFYEKNTA